MLRVATIYACTATATANYYAPYLDPAETDEAPGRWWGRQAAALDLDGVVRTEQLEAVLSGVDPVSGEGLGAPFRDRVNKHGKLIKAVAGFDATFSAPKSVSVWWALTGDDGILDAHNLAVRAVLDHLETYGCTTRVRDRQCGRFYPDAQGLVVGVFQQSTSREDDPQLHTHAVISSKVRDPNGGWYALDAKYLKSYQRALGGIYQSVLRAELTFRYGVTWGPIAEAQAELADIPAELLELFSKRTAQVEEAGELMVQAFRELEGRDPTRIERARLYRQAAKESRPDKSGLPVADAAAGWLDQAHRLGWTGPALTARLCGQAPPATASPDLAEVLNVASAKASAWTRMDLLKAICDLAQPQPGISGTAWAQALEAAADDVAGLHVDLDPTVAGQVRSSDGRSVRLQPYKNHLSHDLVLAQEERILDFAAYAQGGEPRPSPTVDVDGLDVLQGDAARAVAGKDRMVLVVGPAGAGKTTMLERATRDLHYQGRPVFGVAPTRKSTRVLAGETGMPADTVAKLLAEHDRPDGPEDQYRLIAGTTLVVDEAGMVGTGDLDRLVGLARCEQWRLVLVGDPRQLQAVGRGGMFDELCRTRPTHELGVIHRFTRQWECTATRSLRHGHSAALDAYEEHDRISPGAMDDHLADIAAAWARHHRDGRRVAVTAETNREVDQLNAAIQTHRRHTGYLAANVAVPIAQDETAGVGDVVMTRDNDHSLRTSAGDTVANRDVWTVDQVDPEGSLTVSRLHGQGTVTLPADYVATQVRLGYAATAHGHQGDTVDISYTLVSTSTSHRGLYVGATRGRHDNRLHVVTDEADLAHARDVLEFALTNDRADIPAHVQQRQLAEQANETPAAAPSAPPARDHLAELEAQADDRDRVLTVLLGRLKPFDRAIDAARDEVGAARRALRDLEQQQREAGALRRRRFNTQIALAEESLDAARARLAEAEAAAEPHRLERDQVRAERNQLWDDARAKRMIEELKRPAPERPLEHEAPGLGLELGL